MEKVPPDSTMYLPKETRTETAKVEYQHPDGTVIPLEDVTITIKDGQNK